jgi:predicted nucleic acid-binding protein
MNPRNIPNEWLSIDLGKGESATIALALENSGYIILLDDYLARRIAKAAGLTVWGTLRVLFEAKKPGLIPLIKPIVTKLQNSGMWLSDDLIKRILSLVGE